MTIEHDFNSEEILFPIESMSTMQRAENAASNNRNNDANQYSLDIKNTVFDNADISNIQSQETPLTLGFPPLSFDSPLRATDSIPTTADNSLHLKANINKNYNTRNSENDSENNNSNNTNIADANQYTTLTSPYPVNDILYNMNATLQSPSPSSVPQNTTTNPPVNSKSNNGTHLSPQTSNGNETLISLRNQQQTSINDDHLSFPNPPNNNLFIDTNPNNLNEKLRNQLNSDTNSYSNSISNSNSNSTGNLNSSYFNSLNIDSMLDDYVSSDLLLNDDDDDTNLSHRRFSDVITNQFPSITNSRNSISHSLDLWNHSKVNSSNKNSNLNITSNSNSSSNASPNNTTTNVNSNMNNTGNANNNDAIIDNELTQILNEYNMNFSDNLGTSVANKNNPTGPNSFDTNNMTKINPSQHLQQQLNRFQHKQFASSHNNSSTNMKSFNSDLYSRKQRASLPIIDDPLNYDMINKQNEGSKNDVLPNASSSSSQQFIKPSMILSDNASAIAKVATTGLGNDMSLLTEEDEQNVDPTSNFDLSISQMNMVPSSPASSSSTSLATNHFYHHFPQQNHHTMNSKIGSSLRRRKSAVPLMGAVPLTNQQNNVSSSSVSSGGNGVGVSKERRSSYRRKSMTPSRRSSVVMESTKELEEKPFHCHICSKSFKRSEHLKRHVRSVHSNERPFACHICDKKFSRSDNLSQHIKTHKKHGDI
ncbi:msn2p [Saccharomyces arboricola H-6]|uniref:Msn2p n=1 Tax=Saccharomyces arboricola (strain H-6 / AS 2.3317 / CBS 10644) TaxID=1160507 RepID=J8PK04_SACAR|nr:msn2p [Saccharomyces arboricola H-6]